MPITSAYNFAPLSPQVFFPEWAEHVTHDAPFRDGLSGWIEVEVEAKTPIYIRNGGCFPGETDQERAARLENADWQDFFRAFPGGPYAIPGSTLRGCLRGVLTPASFGKMNAADRRRFGYRDLNAKAIYNDRLTETVAPYTYRPRARAGWLMRAGNDKWEVRPCDFSRVEQVDLEQSEKLPPGTLGKRQSAADKYRAWGTRPLAILFDPGPVQPRRHANDRNGNPTYLEYSLANLSGASTKGYLVFTGQPQSREEQDYQGNWRQPPHRKHLEFVFRDPISATLPVSDKVRAEFEFIHSEADGVSPNQEWKFWRPKLGQPNRVCPQLPGIPVFFLTAKDDAGNEAISAMGLALMFRLPYPYSLGDILRRQQPDLDDPRPDLAELVFGYVRDRQSEPSPTSESSPWPVALKGRVSFDTLVQTTEFRPAAQYIETVLGNPKPTFYPAYVEQPGMDPNRGTLRDPHRTFHHPEARLRGWKRYPVRPAAEKRPPAPPQSKVATRFRPLPAGATFRGRIRMHNVRPVELGALLWAITWGRGVSEPKPSDPVICHSLGMAKPYGYGAVQVRIVDWQVIPAAQGPPADAAGLADALDTYRKVMEAFVAQSSAGSNPVRRWEETEPLRQLLAMADPANSPGGPGGHAYPRLEDFRSFKQASRREGLLPYVPWIDGNDDPPPGPALRPVAPKGHPGEGPPSTAPPPPPPPRDLTGQWVEARVANRRSGIMTFKFPVDGVLYRGMPVPAEHARFRKDLKSGITYRFRIVGLPDSDGFHPLSSDLEAAD